MRHAWAWALVLTGALACGGGGTTPVEDGGGGGGGGGDGGGGGGDGGGDPVLPCGGVVTVRLRGAGLGGLTGFEVETAPLEAKAGAPLAVDAAATGPFELVSDAAHALGKIAPPAGATRVSLTVPVVAAHVAGPEASGDLAVCTPPLEVAFDPAKVSDVRCHVVIELDLARSVVPGATPLLLPQFKLRF